MKLSNEQMDRFLDQHFKFEREDDVAGVLATLAEDATHDVIGWPSGPSHGRDQAKGFYETLFEDLADGEVRSLERRYGDNFMVDESLWNGSAPGRPFGLEGRGRPLSFRLLHVIDFTDTGQIQKEQVWIDLASIIQQLPQDEA